MQRYEKKVILPQIVNYFVAEETLMIASMLYRDGGLNKTISKEMYYNNTDGDYHIFNGLNWVFDFLENIYIPNYPLNLDEDFRDYLYNFEFNGVIRSLKEGETFFAFEPALEITGNLVEVFIVEDIIRTIISFYTNFATTLDKIERKLDCDVYFISPESRRLILSLETYSYFNNREEAINSFYSLDKDAYITIQTKEDYDYLASIADEEANALVTLNCLRKIDYEIERSEKVNLILIYEDEILEEDFKVDAVLCYPSNTFPLIENAVIEKDETPVICLGDTNKTTTNPCRKNIMRLINNGVAEADLVTKKGENIKPGKFEIVDPIYRWLRKEVSFNEVRELLTESYSPGYLSFEWAKDTNFAEGVLNSKSPHKYKVDLSDKLYSEKEKLIGK